MNMYEMTDCALVSVVLKQYMDQNCLHFLDLYDEIVSYEIVLSLFIFQKHLYFFINEIHTIRLNNIFMDINEISFHLSKR